MNSFGLEKENIDGIGFVRYTFKENETADTVSLGMLTGATIPGFVGASQITENNETSLRYITGSRMPLSERLKKPLSCADAVRILTGICDAYISVDEYLILPETIVADTDFIFTDSRDGDTLMMFIPSFSMDVRMRPDILMRNVVSEAIPDTERTRLAFAEILKNIDGASFSPANLRAYLMSFNEDSIECSSSSADQLWDIPSAEKAKDDKHEGMIRDIKPSQRSVTDISYETESSISLLFLLRNFSRENLRLYREGKRRASEAAPAELYTEDSVTVKSDESHRNDTGSTDVRPYLVRLRTGGISPVSILPFRIGKDESASDYAISGNKAISRRHAVITGCDGRYFIRDSGSTNHTYLDGIILDPDKEGELKEGSVLRFADEDFIFRIPLPG